MGVRVNASGVPEQGTRSKADLEGDFLFDVRAFAKAVAEEFTVSFWEGYEERRKEFNQLLARASTWDLASDLEAIAPVPAEHNPWPAQASGAKRAKLREVVNAAERLRGRVEARWARSTPILSDDSLLESYTAVKRLCDRFHGISRILRSRHEDRATLDIVDEYDVQDLLHALLTIYFDDIRPEEYTPSYAGGTARSDFLLKQEKLVIEVKKTRRGLTAKQLGEQLLVDIARYAEHPDCKMLVCFVYDPEGRVSNPRGLESDLEKRGTEQLRVRVLVRP